MTLNYSDPIGAMEPLASLSVTRDGTGSASPLRVCFPILMDGDLVLSPEHLGPAYLAAVLRQAGADVRITEAHLAGDESANIEEILAWSPDVIGLSLTSVALGHACSFGQRLRRGGASHLRIILGGPIATHLGAELLGLEDWTFADGLIRGEGEVPMLRFAEAVAGGRPWSEVPNLIYRDSGLIAETAMRPGTAQLDDLPFPARDQLRSHDGLLPYVRISTSRGCTSHCTFCNAPHARNRIGPPAKGWRGTSPGRVVDEIECLVREFGANTFDFVDSTFEDPGGGHFAKGRITAIAEEILARGLDIYFNVCMQAQNWSEADRPLLMLLRRAGLEKALVGIESGSDQGLHLWQKRATIEDNTRIIRLLRSCGVYVAFGFISFHPWSSFAEIRQNQRFLRDNIGHNLRRYTTRMELYPGAEVVEALREAALLTHEYDEKLNPFGYIFVDSRVARLAELVNGIYGDEYRRECAITTEPAVFRFETHDIMVHNFISRLRARMGEGSAGKGLIDALHAKTEEIRSEMASFNFDLMSSLTDLAEADRLEEVDRPALADRIEAYYRRQISELEATLLRKGMRLRRLGIDTRAIDRSRRHGWRAQ